MGLLDYIDPDQLRGKLKGLLGGMPLTQALRGEASVTPEGLRQGLLAMKPFSGDAGQSAYDAAVNIGPMGLAKIVYHGSPHKFDKFDASKIGTGEGAQAYGHGVYLADAEDVAKGYRRELSNNIRVDSKGVWAKSKADGKEYGPFETLKDAFAGVPQDSGALYKADLPDEWIPKMLDWDKPLREQPENVRLLAQDLGLAKDATGKDVYFALSNQARDMGIIKGQPLQTTLPGSQEQATADLLGFGVPGIRYMDGGSRMTPTQEEAIRKALERATAKGDEGVAKSLRAQLENRTSNYVVFPGLEDKVKILERNGVPLTGLLGK